MTRVWIAVVLVLWSSTGRAQVRDGANATSGSASIEGIVVDEARLPVRRAMVGLRNDAGVPRTVVTDADGRFSFANLAAGRYTLSVFKAAYITSSYGARRPGRPGTAIVLGQGQRLANATLTLARGAVISGTIRNARGEPAAGMTVQAFRGTFTETGRSFVPLGPVGAGGVARYPVTDDRGGFRLFGLEPGDYIVGAVQPSDMNVSTIRLVSEAEIDAAERNGVAGAAPARSGGAPAAPDVARMVAPVPVYFPGVFAMSDAAVLHVEVSEERTGVDFTVRFAPAVSVEGIVVRSDGASPNAPSITMIPKATESVRSEQRHLLGNLAGDFRFNGVPPGEYWLGASIGNGTLSAVTSLVVADAPVSGVVLTLQPGVSVVGRIVLGEGQPESSFTSAYVRVRLMDDATPSTISTRSAQTGPARTFGLSGVTPGRYVMSVTPVTAQSPPAWTVASILVNGQDASDSGFAVAGTGPLDVTVRLTNRIAGLTGVLQDSSGQPLSENTIVLFPLDQRSWIWQSRRIKTARPSSDGAYTFADVPPGEYYVAAVTDVEPNQWFDATFLGQLVPASIRVVIGEGEKKIQDIRLR
jgi:uncharacterized protein (DUF2141 family)